MQMLIKIGQHCIKLKAVMNIIDRLEIEYESILDLVDHSLHCNYKRRGLRVNNTNFEM